MSVYYKNLKTIVDGQTYYASSVDMSESVTMEDFSALGTKGSYSFPSNKPEGTISMNFYITDSNEVSKLHDQLGQTGFLNVSVGPFTVQNALVNSFSIQGESNNILQASASFSYYGQMSSGSVPAKDNATITPAHAASSTVSFSDVGIQDILSFDYSFSQSYEVKYSLGKVGPSKVVFNDATKEMQVTSLISDVDFAKTNLTGASGLCNDDVNMQGVSKRGASISLNDLCQSGIETLYITGYLTSRDITAEPGGEVVETINIVEKYVPNTGCP